jgi:HEAT repeat protein
LLPGARFPALEESIKSREFELRLAAENEALPEHPAAFFFDPGWFPILEEAGGILYVVENFGAGRVLVVDRQSPGNPEELAGALVPFIDGVARDGLRFRPAPLSDDAAALVSRLASKEPGVRMKASRELVRKRPASAFEPLVALLESNDDEVRREAALVLGELRDRRAIPILIRCIARWRGNDVASAWGGLAAIGKEGAFGHLEKALAEGDSELRMDAIKGLAVSRDARAVPALQAAASGDPDTPVREAAGQALRVLGKPR